MSLTYAEFCAGYGGLGLAVHPDKRRAGGHQVMLDDLAEHLLLPTPQAHDAQKGKTAEQVAAMRARGHGVANLNEAMENRFSGESTAQPSTAGNASSAAQLPGQLNLLDAMADTD